MAPVLLDQSMLFKASLSSTNDTTTTSTDCSDLVTIIGSSGLITSLTSFSTISNSSSDNIDDEKSCNGVGHMVYFTDAQQGTLSRVPLFPISTAEVFVQKTGVSLQDNTYYSAYILQETSSVMLSPLNQPVVVLSGVDKINSLSLDIPSK